MAFGTEVDTPEEVESRPGPGGRSVPLCMYRVGRPYTSLTIHVERPRTEADFSRELTEDPLNTRAIPDLGDLAYIHGGVSLSLFLEDTAVTATVQHFDSVERTEVFLRKIAHAALDRLET